MACGDTWTVDQDYIPRYISTASIVIEGMLTDETPQAMTMWTMIGYPPLSHVFAVTLDSIPQDIMPTEQGYTSVYGNLTLMRKKEAFPITRGNGKHYVNLDVIRKYDAQLRKESADEYAKRRK